MQDEQAYVKATAKKLMIVFGIMKKKIKLIIFFTFTYIK